MKPYPKYKDSGVEWIGEIPEHWDITQLKFQTEFINGCAFKPDGWTFGGVPIIRIENLNGGSEFNCFQGEISERFHVRQGDLLFAWSGNVGTSFGPYIWDKDGLFYLNQHIFRLAGYRMQKKYFFWLLKAVTKYVESQTHGIIGLVHVTRGELGGTKVPETPPHEQSNIEIFLDTKARQIDDLIEKKRKQIELLKEYRASVISEAVTKGLNPNVRMKDSGVEWIGEIPEHWDVIRLKFQLNGKLQYGANESAENDDPKLPRYIRITDFGNDGLLHDDTFKSLPMEIAKDYLLNEGDILFARSGATVGKTFQFKNYNGVACYAGYLIRACPDPSKMLSDFLYMFTRSSAYENWKNSSFSQATIQNIGADKYQNLPVTIPSVEEQAIIVRFLNSITEQIDGLVQKVGRQIIQLQSYRTSLISEAVTGKIDVRDWAKV